MLLRYVVIVIITTSTVLLRRGSVPLIVGVRGRCVLIHPVALTSFKLSLVYYYIKGGRDNCFAGVIKTEKNMTQRGVSISAF